MNPLNNHEIRSYCNTIWTWNPFATYLMKKHMLCLMECLGRWTTKEGTIQQQLKSNKSRGIRNLPNTHVVSIVDCNLHQLHTHHNELMCRRQEVNLYGIKEGTPDFQLISNPNSNSTKCIKVHNLQESHTLLLRRSPTPSPVTKLSCEYRFTRIAKADDAPQAHTKECVYSAAWRRRRREKRVQPSTLAKLTKSTGTHTNTVRSLTSPISSINLQCRFVSVSWWFSAKQRWADTSFPRIRRRNLQSNLFNDDKTQRSFPKPSPRKRPRRNKQQRY